MTGLQLRTQKSAVRANVHGVHSLDRFVFTVPELDEAVRFYDAFGLLLRRTNGQLDLRTCGHPHTWGSIFQAPGPKKLQYLRFACFAEDFEAIAARADALGIPRSAPHPLGNAEGLWLLHPDGFPVQLVVGPKSMADARSTPAAAPAAAQGADAGSPMRSRNPKVHPRRLSHVLVFSPDVSAAADFYEKALGLRVSDRSGESMVFLHGAHGSDHHLIAVANSAGPGLHHSSWDVADFDDVGRGMQQMRMAGFAQGWGVGRHALGANYFYHARDPWGSYAEYSCGIDYVPDDVDWQAGDHPLQRSLCAWGPKMPEDFATNFETPA